MTLSSVQCQGEVKQMRMGACPWNVSTQVCVFLFLFCSLAKNIFVGAVGWEARVWVERRVGNENNQRSHAGNCFNMFSYEGNERFREVLEEQEGVKFWKE